MNFLRIIVGIKDNFLILVHLSTIEAISSGHFLILVCVMFRKKVIEEMIRQYSLTEKKIKEKEIEPKTKVLKTIPDTR